ncbi:ankyrin repeat domain-containing protein [Idiomarina sp.]|uniref:ankyrin repeat domain-containing protein n=1 Tax=Idiomarina sp. TaxID=1874361 RepID=UPI002591046A|nr:ankyrin repeat domain-containing protein [Idiomarina sp.]
MKFKFFISIFFVCFLVGCSSAEKILEDKNISIDKNGFIEAASNNDLIAVEAFLELGFDPNVPDGPKQWSGWTPLIAASGNNDNVEQTIRIVKRLLESGANPNIESEGGDTALLMASHTGEPETVSLLIKAGADVNARNRDGKSALMLARSNTINGKDKEIIEILKSSGAVSVESSYRLPEEQADSKLLTSKASVEIREIADLMGCDIEVHDEITKICETSTESQYPNVVIGMQEESDGTVKSIMVSTASPDEWAEPEPGVERVISRYLTWSEIDRISSLYSSSSGAPDVRNILFPQVLLGSNVEVSAISNRQGVIAIVLKQK